jgi:hypothetical protein
VLKLQLVMLGLALFVASRESAAQQTYRRAHVDSSGQLRIVTASGREIRPPKDSDQVGVEQVAISADRRAVGWLALHPNCCTTYPIPLELVVLTSARTRTFTGDGQAIWQWAFSADSRRVSYRQGPVHGPATPHFELRDIRTGRLVSSFDGDSTEVRAAPAWVRALRAPP